MYWYDRWLRTAVHAWLLQTTGSPVCTGFGSDRLLNFTTKTFISILPLSLSVVCLVAPKEGAWEYHCHIACYYLRPESWNIKLSNECLSILYSDYRDVPDLGLDLFHGHCTLWVFFFGIGPSHCGWFFRIPLGLGEPCSVTTIVRKYMQNMKPITDLPNQNLNVFSVYLVPFVQHRHQHSFFSHSVQGSDNSFFLGHQLASPMMHLDQCEAKW